MQLYLRSPIRLHCLVLSYRRKHRGNFTFIPHQIKWRWRKLPNEELHNLFSSFSSTVSWNQEGWDGWIM
jgi:hypothetical protein